MKQKLLLPLFLRTAARFLLLWCLMVLLLSLRELDAQTQRLSSGVNEARDGSLMNAQLVLDGRAKLRDKPAILNDRMSTYYSTYGALGGVPSLRHRGNRAGPEPAHLRLLLPPRRRGLRPLSEL